MAIDCAVQQALDGRHLPPPTDQSRLNTPRGALPLADAHQPVGAHRLIGTLDPNQLSLAQGRRAINQSRGGRAEHYPTRRGDRLHPLRHSDLLTDRGVTQSAGTDFTGDHLIGVQAHPQPQVDPVPLSGIDGKPLGLFLKAQSR